MKIKKTTFMRINYYDNSFLWMRFRCCKNFHPDEMPIKMFIISEELMKLVTEDYKKSKILSVVIILIYHMMKNIMLQCAFYIQVRLLLRCKFRNISVNKNALQDEHQICIQWSEKTSSKKFQVFKKFTAMFPLFWIL